MVSGRSRFEPGKVLKHGEDDVPFPILESNQRVLRVFNPAIKSVIEINPRSIPSDAHTEEMSVEQVRKEAGEMAAEIVQDRFDV